jgi:transposase
MSMLCGLDLHREQITFDALDTATGEVWRGRLFQPHRLRFRRWLTEELGRRAHGEPVAVAVEGCTGWRYVTEEVTAAGFEAHVAEPAETQDKRGSKSRAKTDRTDARLLRELLAKGELPESWVPPEPVLEWRERVRLYKSLVDQRTQWVQRVHAELFQHGLPVAENAIRSPKTRAALSDPALPVTAAARQRIATAYQMMAATDALLEPLHAQLVAFAKHQPACRALMRAHFGIGELIALAVWCELGDCQRFSSSKQVVRHAGLDVKVDQSDRHRASGYLTRQGPATLRWAFYEAAKCSSRRTSPDHPYYAATKQRLDGKLATLSVARKLALRCYHTLRAISPEEVYAIPAIP